MTLVLYGIVRAAHPAPRPAPRGIGTPPGPVRLVRSDPLAAAVSETEEVSELGETEARTALDIMTRLLADGPVLPMCLGSIAPDEAAVREEVLEPLGDELAGRLDALDGLVEVYVDVDEDQRSAVAGALRADGRSASPASPHDLDAQIELGHAVAELVLGRRSEQAEAFLSALRPLARADAPRGPHGGVEDPPLRWAFLVQVDALAAFDAAVVRLRAAYPHLAVEYVGPLPPVDFADRPVDFANEAEPEARDATGPDSFTGSGRWGWASEPGTRQGSLLDPQEVGGTGKESSP